MSADGHTQDPVIKTILQDKEHDSHEHVAHDQATEVKHAWEHFWENARFFAGFLTIILLTVIAYNVDFGSWNKPMTYLLAAIRSAFIAYFLSHLFKDFSFVFRTLCFTLIFLAGMIFLSMWDSELVDSHGRGIGNPIWDAAHPESMHP